jgi:hypothetical protein
MYASLIDDCILSGSTFARVFRSEIWREIHNPPIQFLLTLLLDRNLITPQMMIDRVISAVNPQLTPELAFYFFPEWSTDEAFFDKYLEQASERFAVWDRAYTKQCELKLDGRDLCPNEYRVFKEHRRKGQNHNPIVQLLAVDDVAGFEAAVNEGFDINRPLPMSLFERRKQGKLKEITAIEYCALTDQLGCFKFLFDMKAVIGPRIPKYAAMIGRQKLMQEIFAHQMQMEPALIGGIKGHHFTLLTLLHERQNMPVPPKGFLALFKYKMKG